MEELEKQLHLEVGHLKQTLEVYAFNAFWSCPDPEHTKIEDIAKAERKLYAAVMSYLME